MLKSVMGDVSVAPVSGTTSTKKKRCRVPLNGKTRVEAPYSEAK